MDGDSKSVIPSISPNRNMIRKASACVVVVPVPVKRKIDERAGDAHENPVLNIRRIFQHRF